MNSPGTQTSHLSTSNEDTVEITDNISDVRWTDAPVMLIFWSLFAIVLLQFITRYVFNNSYAWTEEIARYLLIFLCFVGSITCVRKGSHIFIEFFYRYLPLSGTKVLFIIIEFINMAFFAVLGYFAIELVQRTHAQKMVSVDLPKSVIYWVIVGSCFLMALTAAWNSIRLIRTPANTIAQEKMDS